MFCGAASVMPNSFSGEEGRVTGAHTKIAFGFIFEEITSNVKFHGQFGKLV